jgi:hypothetical protein
VSDFDTVLERLLLDPQFKSALGSDAARTLAGYQLSDEERQILLTDMAGTTGAQPLVEDRISKSSMFGLLSSLSGGFANVAEYEEVALGRPDTGPEAVAEYEEIAFGGPDTDGDAVAIKEVDPMPTPHDADTPGPAIPPDGGSPQGGPSPHMSPAELKMATANLHVVVPPDLPSS